MRIPPSILLITGLCLTGLCLTNALCVAKTQAGEGPGALYSRADYSGAVTLLRQAPVNAANLELLGQCWFMLGDFKKATDQLEKAAALQPSDSMIETWLGRAWGRRAESAFPLVAMTYAAKTREAFERAVQMDPANPEAMGDLFDFYMEAPRLIGGGLDKAEALLPRYEHCDPLGYYVARARVEETKQGFASAEADFRHAVEMAPRRISMVLNLAQFLARRGRYEEAENVFRHASALAPDSPRVYFAQADTYIKSRRNVDQARELLRRYLAANNLSPEDPPRWEAQKLLRKAEGG